MTVSLYRRMLPLLGLWLLSAPDALAWCVANGTSEQVHVQSLDASRFEADPRPGETSCCDSAPCLQQPMATVLVVSGYVPLAKAGKPGWQGECRARVAKNGTIQVSGDKRTIHCQAR